MIWKRDRVTDSTLVSVPVVEQQPILDQRRWRIVDHRDGVRKVDEPVAVDVQLVDIVADQLDQLDPFEVVFGMEQFRQRFDVLDQSATGI